MFYWINFLSIFANDFINIFISDDSLFKLAVSTMRDSLREHLSDDLTNLQCNKCLRIFQSSYILTKHIRSCDPRKSISCIFCDYKSNRKWNVKMHIERVHSQKMVNENLYL